MKKADFFISWNRPASNIRSVFGVWGIVRMTKSAAEADDRVRQEDAARSRRAARLRVSRGSTPMTRMPNAAQGRSGFRANAPDADDERRRAWKMHDRSRIIGVPHVPR